MSDKKITVRAGDGLRVFLPMNVASAAGARNLVLAGGATAEVSASDRFVAKRIKVGDLVVVKPTKGKAKPAETTKKKEAE